jgi:diguanylate cyclase
MDPLTAVAGLVALASVGTGARWRRRAQHAEHQAQQLHDELQAQQHAACHDPLTGLPNRRGFYQLGPELIAKHDQQPLAVILIDLDNFKQINDNYGHAAGDGVLITAARRFADYAGNNLVARLGGDEFVGLFRYPKDDSHWPMRATRGLTELLATPMLVTGQTLVVTASVGLVPVHASTDLAEAVCHADAAMYRVKHRFHPVSRYRRPSRAQQISCAPTATNRYPEATDLLLDSSPHFYGL